MNPECRTKKKMLRTLSLKACLFEPVYSAPSADFSFSLS